MRWKVFISHNCVWFTNTIMLPSCWRRISAVWLGLDDVFHPNLVRAGCTYVLCSAVASFGEEFWGISGQTSSPCLKQWAWLATQLAFIWCTWCCLFLLWLSWIYKVFLIIAPNSIPWLSSSKITVCESQPHGFWALQLISALLKGLCVWGQDWLTPIVWLVLWFNLRLFR